MSTQTPLQLAHQAILDAVADGLQRYMLEASLAPNVYGSMVQFLTIDLPNIRFELLNSIPDVAQVWESVRVEEAYTDLVFETTSAIRRACDLNGAPMDSILELYANSWGVLRVDKKHEANAAINGVDAERIVTSNEMLLALRANPWLLSLFLLRQAPAALELKKEMFEIATRNRARTATAAQQE